MFTENFTPTLVTQGLSMMATIAFFILAGAPRKSSTLLWVMQGVLALMQVMLWLVLFVFEVTQASISGVLITVTISVFWFWAFFEHWLKPFMKHIEAKMRGRYY